MWQPSKTGDNADDNPQVIANHLRALQAEMRSGFEVITQKVLDRLDRFEGKLDVIADRQNIQQSQIDEFRRWREHTDARLAEIEAALAAR